MDRASEHSNLTDAIIPASGLTAPNNPSEAGASRDFGNSSEAGDQVVNSPDVAAYSPNPGIL